MSAYEVMPKVIAFDLFGTVAKMAAVPPEETRQYLGCCTARPWQPQNLPESWRRIPAFCVTKATKHDVHKRLDVKHAQADEDQEFQDAVVHYATTGQGGF